MGSIFGVDRTASGARVAEYKNGRSVLLTENVLMMKLKARLEQITGAAATDIVLAVPAGFSLYARNALNDAWKGTGLTVVRMISDHTAAALQYAAEYQYRLKELLAVVECHDSTTKVSLIELERDVIEEYAFHMDRQGDPSDILRKALENAGRKIEELHTVLILDSEERAGRIRYTMQPGSRIEHRSRAMVAQGAAILGGILRGTVREPVVMQTIPCPIGVETETDAYTRILEANTIVPAMESGDFRVPQGASKLDFTVWEQNGNSYDLASYRISGIPAGTEKVTIQLDLNTNSVLSVRAYLPDDPQKTLTLTALEREVSATKKQSAPPAPDQSQLNLAVVQALMPIYDNLLLAVESPTSDAAYKKGIEQIFQNLNKQLSDLGAAPYGAVGEVFDPNIHNAVLHLPDITHGENEITRVFRRGFRMNGKILRVADVQVAN